MLQMITTTINLIWSSISEVQMRNIWKIEFKFPLLGCTSLSPVKEQENGWYNVPCKFCWAEQQYLTVCIFCQLQEEQQWVANRWKRISSWQWWKSMLLLRFGFERSFTGKLLPRINRYLTSLLQRLLDAWPFLPDKWAMKCFELPWMKGPSTLGDDII